MGRVSDPMIFRGASRIGARAFHEAFGVGYAMHHDTLVYFNHDIFFGVEAAVYGNDTQLMGSF